MSVLGPSWLVAKAEMRGRRGTLVVVALVAALVGGATLTTASGARRTATSVDRLMARQTFPEFAIGTYLLPNVGDPATLRRAEEALAAIDGVDRAVATANVYAALGSDDGSWSFFIRTGIDDRFLRTGTSAPVADGRLPAVDGRREIAIGAGAAEHLGLGVGDELVAPTFSVDTMNELITGLPVDVEPDGPELRFTVVGVLRPSLTDDPSRGFGLASPDTAAYLSEAGTSDAYIEVFGDATAAEAARDAVADVMGGNGVYAIDYVAYFAPIRDTVRVAAIGWALFALVAAAAGLVALGQVVGRQVADGSRFHAVASALGMRRGETAVSLVLPSATAVGVGTVVGAGAAVVLSPLFPTGLARVADPDPGVRIDGWVLGAGAAALVTIAVAWTVGAAFRSLDGSARQRRRPYGHRSGLRRRLPIPAAIGAGLVLVPNRIRSAVRPTSALLGAVLGVTGVVAITVFVASQQTTAGDPARFGWGWSADADLSFDDPGDVVDAVAADPTFDGVGVLACKQASTASGPVTACAPEILSGSISMTMLDGRAPTSPAEVAVGAETLDDRGLTIGDELEITGADGSSEVLEIVGVVVFPDTTSSGDGLVVTPATLERLDRPIGFAVLMMVYPADLDREAVERHLTETHGLEPDRLSYPEPPSLVRNLELVRGTLVSLAVFLALLGVIGLLHFLLLSNTRRRQETAVLRAMGFVRSQTVGVVVWQGVTVATVGVVVGGAAGLILGRTAWIWTIDHLGIVDVATVPWAVCAGFCVLALLGAATIGLLSGWSAARRRPAVALRHE